MLFSVKDFEHYVIRASGDVIRAYRVSISTRKPGRGTHHLSVDTGTWLASHEGLRQDGNLYLRSCQVV
jgi:hypothetical protein